MPVPDQDPFNVWRDRRAARIAAKASWVRDVPSALAHSGPVPISYVADEVLVRDEHHDTAVGLISAMKGDHGPVTTRTAIPGFRVLRAGGLDAMAATRQLRTRLGAAPGTAPSLNHVFMSTPFEHGGPYGGPAAVATQVQLNVPGTAAARVAVLDTGVWASSPLPRTSYLAMAEDFETEMDTDADGFVDPDVGHANFIAGVILSRSANAGVRILKVLDPLGLCTEVELAQALIGLTDVELINLSLGGFTADDQPPAALQAALQTVLSGHDRVVVAAAGNDGQNGRPFWPAAFSAAGQPWSDQVLAVAAHDGNGVCEWSNRGPWVTLAAPGHAVTSTYVNRVQFDGGWATWSGTSFAAPYVAAAIADQMPANGSVLAAAQHVRKIASGQAVGGYPALT